MCLRGRWVKGLLLLSTFLMQLWAVAGGLWLCLRVFLGSLLRLLVLGFFWLHFGSWLGGIKRHLLQLILFLDESLEVGKDCLEPSKNHRSQVTVARGVVTRVNRVHDYKSLLAQCRQLVERHVVNCVDSEFVRIKVVCIKV